MGCLEGVFKGLHQLHVNQVYQEASRLSLDASLKDGVGLKHQVEFQGDDYA